MSPDQIYFVSAVIGIPLALAAVHLLRLRITLGPFFGLAGVCSMMVWQILQTGWWVNFGPLYFNAGLSLFVPTILLGNVLAFSLDGLTASRAYLLMVALTANAAWAFTVFREHLAQYVPLPYLVVLSNREHFSFISATLLAMVICAVASTVLHSGWRWLTLMAGLFVGLCSWLVIYSLINFNPGMAWANLGNEFLPFMISGAPALVAAGLYGLYADRASLLMPRRDPLALLAVWREVETVSDPTRDDDTMNREAVISELQMLNRQLSRNVKIMDAHMASAAYGVVITDARGRIAQCNEPARRLLGSGGELVGKAFQPLLAAAAEPSTTGAHAAGDSGERRVIRSDAGPGRTVEITVTPLLRDKGVRGGESYVIVKDVTEIVADEKRKLASGRVKDLDHTGRVLAHDFSNLLIGAQAHLAHLRRLAVDPAAAESLEALDAAIRNGRDMIRHLHGNAFGSPQLRHHDLGELLAEAVAICRAAAVEAGVQITLETLPAAPVDVDSSQIVRVITNLIRNSLRASAPGSRIRVWVRDHVADFEVVVDDQGSGMTDDGLAMAFDPGFSSKGQGKGGLGLAISYLMIDAHGGTLELQHNPDGDGIRAIVRLPKAEQLRTASELSGKSVIILSGDAEHAARLAEHFESELGCVVAEAHCPDEVLALLADDPDWELLLVADEFAGQDWLDRLPAKLRESVRGLEAVT